MRRFFAATGGTVIASLLIIGTVAAAGPSPSPSAAPAAASGSVVSTVLGLNAADLRDLRHDGLSLAQIAERQKVAVQKVIDAIVARSQERIETRVENGALTEAQAAALKAQLQTRATTMVNQTALGGMQGAAVGAGPRNGAGNGDMTQARDGSGTGTGAGPRGTGSGTCDGTGPNGAGQP